MSRGDGSGRGGDARGPDTFVEVTHPLGATPDADAAGGDPAAPRGWYLLVFEQQGSYMFPLPGAGEVVIGRAEGCELRLDDAVASRRHARVVVSGGEVVVEDLGSQNGTRVGGERLERPRALASGDVIGIGSAQLVFHREPRRTAPRALLDATAFRQRAEAELERSRRAHAPLALIVVLHGGAERTPLGRALAGALRVLDAATWGGEDELTVVAPDVDAREARLMAARLAAALSPAAPRARLGVALSPDDGNDLDDLLGVARAAAAAAPPEGVRTAADLPSTREIGGRTIVVADPAMVRLYALVERLAQSDLPVLIGGETGSGKEIVASTLHALSRRAGKPFLALNCAALPENLIESELFGHERGAFTGAAATKVGLLEAATTGTVLLDEVGELSPAAQAKILRVLETQRLTRVGGVAERPIDTRVVAATHRELTAEVAAGRFRQDLYFRLAAARVAVPPLRHRARELTLLSRVILDEACARAGRAPVTLSPAALYALLAHAWPGNVRELKNAMEYVAATVAESTVEPWHLPEGVRPEGGLPVAPPATTLPPGGAAAARAGDEQVTLPARVPPASPSAFRPIDEEIRELEQLRMSQALAAAGGVQTRAAELIGMPLRTFVTKLKLYGLAAPSRARRR